MKDEHITKSEEETISLGEEFARKLEPQDVVFLVGDLGSGKTAFTKGLAKGLGIQNRIISPTFVVVRTHSINNKNSKIKRLYHLDLYRLRRESDVKGIDLKDFLEDKSGVVVIEWPNLSQNIIKGKTKKVMFDILDEKRKITFA